MPSDGNLYNIYNDNINSDPSIGLGLVLPPQVDAFQVLNLKNSTNQPYIPVHSDTALQALGQISANSANTLINFFSKKDPANLSANKPIGLFQGNERLRSQFNKDIFIRGGISAPSYAVEDAQRLVKFFFDKKDVTGLLFTIKQNVLSLTNVKTIASPTLINGGVYLPTSTIAQAGVNTFGVHLNKQGIDPTGLLPFLSLQTYEDAAANGIKRTDKQIERLNKKIKRKRARRPEDITTPEEDQTRKEKRKVRKQVRIDSNIEDLKFSSNNNARLYSLWTRHIQTPSTTNKIWGYLGGPGSILGIGYTKIKFAKDPKGKNLRTGESNILFQNTSELFYDDGAPKNTKEYRFLFGGVNPEVTNLYRPRNKEGVDLPPKPADDDSQQQIFPKDPNLKRPDYKQYNIENTYNFNSPGKKGNRNNYTTGKIDAAGTIQPSDKINYKSIYYNQDPIYNDETRDIINFNIGVIDNNSDNLKDTYWMPFRAFIDDFSDKYAAKWKGQKYMGRAEQFYKYDSFDRDISLSMKVVAQSKEELMVQYEKLNFLASTLAPTYTNYGYMSGNLHRITVGGYLDDQVCIIESLSFDFKDSPWEIGIDTEGNYDDNTSQLPHFIKVQMKITPIHNFRVEMDRKGDKKYIARTSPKGSNLTQFASSTFSPFSDEETQALKNVSNAINISQGLPITP